MATTIYALCEPDLMVPVIRYIGKTANMAQRRSGHSSASCKKKTHLGYWLRSLRERGETPVWLTLTEVPDELGSAAEVLYIRLAREGGMDLVNTTDGGESGPMVPEIRRKIGNALRGKHKTPEHCAAMTGPHSPARRATLSAAKRGVLRGPYSPAHCAAISASKRGVPLSPEQCAAISAAKRGVPQGPRSPEHCAAIRQSWILRKMPVFSDGGGI